MNVVPYLLINLAEIDLYLFLLNQMCSWFLEIALVHVSVCVLVSVCPPESINNQWHGMVWYRQRMIH